MLRQATESLKLGNEWAGLFRAVIDGEIMDLACRPNKTAILNSESKLKSRFENSRLGIYPAPDFVI